MRLQVLSSCDVLSFFASLVKLREHGHRLSNQMMRSLSDRCRLDGGVVQDR